jgi:nucleotide-binding universal stress UspA family protein
MLPFKRILVPVDGSRYSLDAVCLASQMARFHDSDLMILHVVDESLLDQLARFAKKNREAIREELKESAQGFLDDMQRQASQEAVSSEIMIQEGVPHEIILEEAARWGADLIVMGKLGRRGITRILLGSVAERVIEFSDIPVLVVK